MVRMHWGAALLAAAGLAAAAGPARADDTFRLVLDPAAVGAPTQTLGGDDARDDDTLLVGRGGGGYHGGGYRGGGYRGGGVRYAGYHGGWGGYRGGWGG